MTSLRSTGFVNAWKEMSETSGRPSTADQRPQPRIQSLSDLIFGLALSIGALILIGSRPSNAQELLGNIATFGFSFLILIFVWFRYTEIMSVLPVETTGTRALNSLMLFLVAIEPYLFNQLNFGFTLVPVAFSTLSQDVASATYALDLGAIWAILAAFTHVLTVEEKNLVAGDLLMKYRRLRSLELVVAAIFFISALPPFWTAGGGTSLRYVLWAATFFVRRTGNLYSRLEQKRSRGKLKSP
jgi:uncharacterized membrane protein